MSNVIWNQSTIKAILAKAAEYKDLPWGTKLYFQPNDKVELRTIVYKMLRAMYDRQTLDEKTVENTKHTNDVGFNKPDGIVLSRIAKSAAKYNNLTTKQAAYVAKRLFKYAAQLESIAAAKTGVSKGTPKPPATVPEAPKSTVSGDPNAEWAAYKNEYAALEAKQEQAAFQHKMNW